MALQQINWLQIDTENVQSGSIINLGNPTGALHIGYFDDLYVSGQPINDFIAGAGTAELNIFSASVKTALQFTGSNLTVIGDLLVKGTTTSISSNTVSIGDNIIELNGNSSINGGLLIKDPTSPNTISGSLLWDSANDYWKGGPLGSEKRLVIQSGSGTENFLQKSAGDGSIKNSRISDDGTTVKVDVSNTGSFMVTGSMKVVGDLIVEGKTTLVQTLDPNVESLVVSGAMSIVKNEISGQIVSASIKMQNIILAEHVTNVNIIDCGDGFF